MKEILSGLAQVAGELPVVLPLHPRTRKLIGQSGLSDYLRTLVVTDPLSFLDMMALERAARLILTDSGGVQKEAFFYGVPCITMREETEWVETVQAGWNQLTGADAARIAAAARGASCPRDQAMPYGDGQASRKIVDRIGRA